MLNSISVAFSGFIILFAAGTACSQEHVWLHVDGKYIKKSPAGTAPNGIWMGCGVAFAQGSEPLTRAKADEFAL